MQIYTEFCEGGDLQEFLEIKKPEELNLESLTWIILEGLASALARCHHGLKTTSEFDTVYHYTGFEKDWRPILHRDIKPANILVAIKDKALIPKLGDFGTSFRLEENGKPPSTVAGTRLYWAPEIIQQDLEGRITNWSKESDIWAVGMVLCEILTADKPDIQPNDWPENVKQLQNPTEKSSVAVSRLLAYIVSECLSPSVDGRPSALQLLAVVMKSDISSKGLERSESFWRVIATRADSKLASSIVTRFVSEYLPLLEQQTVFSILETTLIMSLTYKYCPEQITQCHCVLYNNLFKDEEGELVGSTAFHGITWLPKKEDEILRLALEDSRWPSAKELSHLAIAKNKTGLLPSALAALQGKRDLCVYLTGIE
ncbi:kinase-like domain-containing protein [Xylaria grammica]|nr:kinase-like domain-containing protein [Xylaria grammica]